MRETPRRQPLAEVLAYDCELPDPPEKVWQALTVPELLGAWLMPKDILPKPDARSGFEAPDSEPAIQCEVIESDPCRLLRLAWRETDLRSDRAVDSVVTFALARTTIGGTHLSIVHDGFVVARARPAVAMAGLRLSFGGSPTKAPPAAANAPRPLMRAA